ncbi:MAG: chemotaxis protein CheR [Actinomycetospora sp.]|nr:chemotaxis protein CheR [Actinomycetospora sp.]
MSEDGRDADEDLDEGTGTADGTADGDDPAQDAAFETLLQFIKESRGFDFTGYKRSSIRRRVARRMQMVGAAGHADYLDLLQVDQDEFTHLFNTVLINVTGFLRDPEAWRELQEQIVPQLLAAKERGEAIRVWSAGCASGEEAYGLAMVFAEALGAEEFRQRVKVYATDVDEDALATARQASYGERELEAVPAEWRERYFERVADRYVFRSDLRRSVIFGRNDLVQDAPIGRLDLLVCRNTLMYLNAETQARVLRRFHFALNPTGVMFLGKAEMLLSHGRLFLPVDIKRRFFRKADQVNQADRLAALTQRGPYAESRRDVALEDETLLMSPLATIVVTADDIVTKANQRAEAQLGVSTREIGRRFTELEVCHRITGLRSSYEDVRRHHTVMWQHEAEFVRSGSETLVFDVQLVPLDAHSDDGVSVAMFFTDVTRYRRMTAELQSAHRQVETAYEELQSTVEELETTNEELQSTVEELETTNEELHHQRRAPVDERRDARALAGARPGQRLPRVGPGQPADRGGRGGHGADRPGVERPGRRPVGCARRGGDRPAPAQPRHRPGHRPGAPARARRAGGGVAHGRPVAPRRHQPARPHGPARHRRLAAERSGRATGRRDHPHGPDGRCGGRRGDVVSTGERGGATPSQVVDGADVAARWGFTHAGRFSALSRRRYGCSPRETLRA